MPLEYVPTLKVQRELYALPRGTERFRAYLRTLTDAATGDLKLPLGALNPMGKDHVPALLDALLALDADGVGARALEDVRAELDGTLGGFRVTLCVSDDLLGGWTDRGASEFQYRFEQEALAKRGWICALLWTSERHDAARVREELLGGLFRAAHVARHGPARSLRERLAQEGAVQARARTRAPALAADELAYAGEVLAPLLETRDWPTAVAALFGDEAARKLGLAPLGLARFAGLEWAFATARAAVRP
jgi:hypothetical protein